MCPWADPELNSEYFTVAANGPVVQTSIVQDAIPPATIAASSSYTTGVIISNGYRVIAIGATSTNAGAINVQRYLNREGTVPAKTSVDTVALVGGTGNVLVVNGVTDGTPFASFSITITNTVASIATLTGFYVLLQAL